jgi:hypothetical protein
MKPEQLMHHHVSCTLLTFVVLAGCGQSKTTSSPAKSTAVLNREHLSSVAANGDPVTLGQLNQIYDEPTAEQNAASLYGEAFAALNAEDKNSPSFLSQNREAVRLLLLAADRPRCRYPIALTDGARVLLPHLSGLRKCAILLRQEAVSQAAGGKTDAATAAILAGLRMGRSLDGEPLLVSKLVQLQLVNHALDGLQESLDQSNFTDDELLRILEALNDLESAVGFRRAFVGERAMVIDAFQSSDEELAEAMGIRGDGASAAPPFMLREYRAAGHLDEDFAFALDFMSKLVSLAEQTYPEALDEAGKVKIPSAQDVLDQKLVVSVALLPDPARLVLKSADTVARIRLARTVLAIERYKLKHDGALPVSLDDVAVDLAGGVPKDPFDGQTLRYKVLPSGVYSVYSIGEDREDDGGSVPREDIKLPVDIAITAFPKTTDDAINAED